jgi:hypothetical protein
MLARSAPLLRRESADPSGGGCFTLGRSNDLASGRLEVVLTETVRVGLVAGATRGAGRAIAVVGVTPGWLRSEKDAGELRRHRGELARRLPRASRLRDLQSATYVARGVAELARAADAERWAGTIASARHLADAYGITDTDGSRPDCWGYHAAYGWEP